MKKIKFKNEYVQVKIKKEEEYIKIHLTTLQGTEIGNVHLQETYIEEYIDAELDYYKKDINEQYYNEEELNNLDILENDISNKTYAYNLTELHIDEKFRNNGFGRLLLDILFKELEEDLENSIMYLNACPKKYERGALNLQDLVQFYKKSGFEESYAQGGNVNMILKDKNNIKTRNDIKYKTKEKTATTKESLKQANHR